MCYNVYGDNMVKIGIPLRYTHLENGRGITFLSELIRIAIQKAGAFVIPIIPVQGVDYYETHYADFKELDDIEKRQVDEYLNMVDGVLFPGGHKVTPYDEYLLNRCIELDKKVLGICLGMQLISSYKIGFKMYQNYSSVNHNQGTNDDILSHSVKISKDSKLYEIVGTEEIMVNSYHNFHVENICDNMIVSAVSEDNYIEAIELKDKTFVMGLQWHPEINYDTNEYSKKIIDYFIKICDVK